MVQGSVGEGFLATFGSGDPAKLEAFYADDAVLYAPITGPLRGREAIGRYFRELHEAFPGMRVALHDEFASSDGSRTYIRTHVDWQNAGPFWGNPATGRSGDMAETHTFRLAGGRVVEQFAGVAGFQIPQLFLADWGISYPRFDDPGPEIFSAAPADEPDGNPDASLARRFVDAFGRRDIATLNELYAEDVVLYTPLAWPVIGRDAVVNFATEFHNANPGLRISVHDEFYSADGGRASWRLGLHFHNTGPFYGNPPTGESGTMIETQTLRVADGRLVEQVVGDNSLHLPHQELVTWKMPFADKTPDPEPAIASVVCP